MQYKSNKGYTGLGQLGMIFCFIGLGLILTTIMQVMIGFQIAPNGTPIDKMNDAILEAMKNPKNLGLIRLMQVLSTFFMFFIPALLYSFVCNGKKLFWLGFNKYFNFYQILLGFLIIFTANIVIKHIFFIVFFPLFQHYFFIYSPHNAKAYELYSHQI